MSAVIVLTADQAGEVRGVSAETQLAALRPVPLTDGRYILPVDVLDDPAHAAHRAFLLGLETIGLAEASQLMPPARGPAPGRR